MPRNKNHPIEVYKQERRSRAEALVADRVCPVCQKPLSYKQRFGTYCSRSCANKTNSHLKPKRQKKQRFCKYCGVPIGTGRCATCDQCGPNKRNWDKITLGETQQLRKYQVSSRIRTLARRAYIRAFPSPVCRICGYSKHVEIHHIKPVSSFSSDTPISVINQLENLIALCPNCHWEFDHGILKL